MIMAQNRDVDLKHETGNLPLALFDTDGSMRKTAKSQLLHIL